MKQAIALITGAAQRIGKAISAVLHAQGYHVVIHYNHSQQAASEWVDQLNERRAQSASLLQGDLLQTSMIPGLVQQIVDQHGQLNVLINNASSFYPTPLGDCQEAQWEKLMGTNLKAPLWLAQAAKDALIASRGQIINITDIHATRPLKHYACYSVAKAGLTQLTRVLAKELAPWVRVNAVAPGAIAWPQGKATLTAASKAKIIEETALKRSGSPDDIARAVLFLLQAEYITGQTLRVDGGRHLYG